MTIGIKDIDTGLSISCLATIGKLVYHQVKEGRDVAFLGYSAKVIVEEMDKLEKEREDIINERNSQYTY